MLSLVSIIVLEQLKFWSIEEIRCFGKKKKSFLSIKNNNKLSEGCTSSIIWQAAGSMQCNSSGTFSPNAAGSGTTTISFNFLCKAISITFTHSHCRCGCEFYQAVDNNCQLLDETHTYWPTHSHLHWYTNLHYLYQQLWQHAQVLMCHDYVDCYINLILLCCAQFLIWKKLCVIFKVTKMLEKCFSTPKMLTMCQCS